MSATCPEFLGILDFHGTISADGTFALSETPFGVSLTGMASQETISGTWRIENVAAEGAFTGSRTSLRPGDANCDGAVNSVDALEILQFVGSEDSLPCEPFADADLSGAVNEFDAIAIFRTEAQITEFPCKVGDVINDGIVNSADALAILQLASGVEPPLNWLPCLYLADVNYDGSVNAVDAQLVLQYVSTH